MHKATTCSSPSPIQDPESRKKISKTFSTPTGKPNAPNDSAPALDCPSPKELSRRMAGRSGVKVSKAAGRNSSSRYRLPGRKPRSTRNGRRNLQHIADAQLCEEPDQPAPFLISSLIDSAQ